MIWIAIGLVAVLTIGVVLYVFYLRPRAYARLGWLDVPGTGTISLPAGEIGVFYEDSQRWRYSDRPQLGDGFSVLVSDESGARVEIAEPGAELVWKLPGKNRIPYGVLSISSPGTFKVVSQLTADLDMARVTFGEPV